jgi:ABC-2 type transport system permease protein
MIVLESATRILAFIGKELVETARRPWAVITLVVGPLALLLAFGVGFSGVRRPLNAVIVIPPSSGLPADPSAYQTQAIPGLHLIAIAPDATQAEADLQNGSVDVVVIAPSNLQQRLLEGQQSVIRIEYSIIDPIRLGEAQLLSRQVASLANERLIEQVAAKGEAAIPSAGPSPIPPQVIAAPTRSETANLAPTDPNVVAFFGIAGVALILQHLAVTLFALSLVRERVQGRFEIFRVAPVRTFEVLLGKGLAYGALATVVALATMLLLTGVIGVPDLAQGGSLALVLGLVIAASLALGALVATVSDSERQVVQLSLFLLLASVFFGGFVLSVDEFRPAAQLVAYALPVTHAISLMQNAMLRGVVEPSWELAALGALAITFSLASWVLLRRSISLA